MLVLGIETSCDETAAAIVKDGREILSNVVASSQELHTKTGGIIPENAARQQIKAILPVINESLENAGVNKSEIDALGVTVGPGLIGSLLVGVETAKTLSVVWNKPLIPVNHLVGHVYANWLDSNTKDRGGSFVKPRFPALALVVSGGHTDLVVMKKHPSAGSGQAKNLRWLGGTRDDAAGEAFDKTARLLDLPYPGGPAIAAQAEEYFNNTPNANHKPLSLFPRPMERSDGFDWSFSGLKTAVLRQVKGKKLTVKEKQKLAAEIQEAIVDVLVTKTSRAVERYKPKSLLLSGGVAANKRLKKKFSLAIRNLKSEVSFFVPPPKYCTDNAAMIASAAFFNPKEVVWQKIKADPSLTITDTVF